MPDRRDPPWHRPPVVSRRMRETLELMARQPRVFRVHGYGRGRSGRIGDTIILGATLKALRIQDLADVHDENGWRITPRGREVLGIPDAVCPLCTLVIGKDQEDDVDGVPTHRFCRRAFGRDLSSLEGHLP